jgi:hypothetical protein
MDKIIILFMALVAGSKSNQDLISFVLADQTNTMEYSESFDCVQFSEEFIKNAKLQRFDAIPVMVGWKVDGALALHEFVAVQTADGVAWVEPQNDRFYDVSKSGGPLCYTDGECVTDKLSFMFYDGEFQDH